MDATCNSNFDRDGLALYRYQRYQQSLAENGNFYFGPKSVLLYGAASFLYELFPSYGPAGTPSLEQIGSFFGAESNGAGGFTFNNAEQIPPNWFNRVVPYDNALVTLEIVALYAQYPVLFGGNVGQGNFDALGSFGGVIEGGKLSLNESAVLCLLYQLATEDVPSSLSGVLELPATVLNFAIGKLNPIFESSGCPLKEPSLL